MNKNLSTAIGITSVAASILGIYYLVKKNGNPIPKIINVHPENQPEILGQNIIGTTVFAKENGTIINHAIDRGDYWEKADSIRLVRKKGEEIGTIIAIINDGFTNDSYAIIDIPFYVGSPLNVGHGFVNTNLIKVL